MRKGSAGLMTAAEEGPGEEEGRSGGRRPEERGEKMTGFAWREGNKRGCGEDGVWLATQRAQEGEGEQDEGDMTRPAGEAADLGEIESQVFASLEILLDVPTCAPGRDHGLEGSARGGTGQEKPEQGGSILRAADEEEVLAIVAALVEQGETCPVGEARAFAAVADGEGMPAQRRAEQGGDSAHLQAAHGAIRQDQDDGFLARDRQDEGKVVAFEKSAQIGVLSVDGISDDPGDG